ncbi:MAG: glycosyltransferase [Prosthecobacter sp.]|uniref:glycosyltransferase n=1 Tax=Prosthecobacter sp. TaxID=1965333 RepID=UPI003BAE3348
MKKILIMTYGSCGDILPLNWLGKLLRARGHDVTLITTPDYASYAAQSGLKFVATKNLLGREMVENPDMSKKLEGTRLAYHYSGLAAGEFVEAVETWMSTHGRPDLMLGLKSCYGARLLREKLGLPLVTVHHYPLMMQSAYEPSLLTPAFRWLRMLPLWMRKLIFAAPNPFDRHALAALRPLCATHGVAVPRDLEREWGHSQDGVLALFPDWFAKRQPDWPQNLLQWHFSLEDLGDVPLAPDLVSFLKSGDKPVLFTPGSGPMHAHRFFEVAVKLVEKLQCRAVFVTRHLQQLPSALPPSIHAVEYAPFSTLLPHAKAFVHHGGQGTVAQCFAAGIPQLIMPMAHDQFDNADRVERLGAGLTISVDRFDVPHAMPLLKRCLTDETIRRRAALCAERMRQQPPADQLIAWLEARMSS